MLSFAHVTTLTCSGNSICSYILLVSLERLSAFGTLKNSFHIVNAVSHLISMLALEVSDGALFTFMSRMLRAVADIQ